VNHLKTKILIYTFFCILFLSSSAAAVLADNPTRFTPADGASLTLVDLSNIQIKAYEGTLTEIKIDGTSTLFLVETIENNGTVTLHYTTPPSTDVYELLLPPHKKPISLKITNNQSLLIQNVNFQQNLTGGLSVFLSFSTAFQDPYDTEDHNIKYLLFTFVVLLSLSRLFFFFKTSNTPPKDPSQ